MSIRIPGQHVGKCRNAAIACRIFASASDNTDMLAAALLGWSWYVCYGVIEVFGLRKARRTLVKDLNAVSWSGVLIKGLGPVFGSLSLKSLITGEVRPTKIIVLSGFKY